MQGYKKKDQWRDYTRQKEITPLTDLGLALQMGDRVQITRPGGDRQRKEIIIGRVAGFYPHHILLQLSHWRTCIPRMMLPGDRCDILQRNF